MEGRARLPIPTEARGKLRRWRQAASARWDLLEALTGSDLLQDIAVDFVQKGTEKGRMRALKKLRRLIDPHAHFQVARLHPKPRALWCALRPREGAIIDPDTPGEAQDAVQSFFVTVSKSGRELTGLTGLWTLEASEHCAGRLLQRLRDTDLDAILLEAHHSILKLGPLEKRQAGGPFAVPVSAGMFVSKLVHGISETTRLPVDFIRLKTFFANDQLTDEEMTRWGLGNLKR